MAVPEPEVVGGNGGLVLRADQGLSMWGFLGIALGSVGMAALRFPVAFFYSPCPKK